MAAVALADARVRETLDAIEHAGLLGRATVFVVSDHGFKEVRQLIKANAGLRAAGLVQVGPDGAVSCDAWVVPEGGTAMVYVTDPSRRDELTPRVREVLAALPGVERMIEPGEYAAMGLPSPVDNDQMADLVAVAKPGYSFAGGHDGEPVVAHPEGVTTGAHGYVTSDPEMNAVFVAWGWGVKRGAKLGVIRNVDVAPTVGAVLGVALPGAEGRVLGEILK
jgi:predicted AlkP superfamily pyrophosphatase or phosphodiesterase